MYSEGSKLQCQTNQKFKFVYLYPKYETHLAVPVPPQSWLGGYSRPSWFLMTASSHSVMVTTIVLGMVRGGCATSTTLRLYVFQWGRSLLQYPLVLSQPAVFSGIRLSRPIQSFAGRPSRCIILSRRMSGNLALLVSPLHSLPACSRSSLRSLQHIVLAIRATRALCFQGPGLRPTRTTRSIAGTT